MRIAVTGGSGFLGSVLSREASRMGHEVMVWTQQGPPAGSEAAGTLHLTWEASPAGLAGHISAFAPDCIIHCAGSASVADSLKDPHADLRASLGTWSVLLEEVRLSGGRPLVIFPSSAAVYGNPAALPVREDAPRRPVSPYGMHKKLCEDLAAEYLAHFGVPTLVLRLFSVLGPSQKRLLVRELYERCAADTGDVVIAGTGGETRDFLSEWCVADAMVSLAALSKQTGSEVPGSVLNLASGEERTVLEVAHCMRDLVCPGRPVSCRGEARPGDPVRWHADVAGIKKLVPAWRPLPFRTALERTVAAWRTNPTS
jgi:UDP-glucose 4-epimerase